MSRPPRWLVVTLALGLPALGLAGAWFYLAQRQYLQQVASVNLRSVAQAKLDQIANWRAERLADAAVLQESPFFVRAVTRWVAGGEPEIRADILTRLRSNKDHYGYDDVRLVDRAGRILLSSRGRTGDLDSDEVAALGAALRDRRPTMGSVHVSSDDSLPHLSVVAPLFAGSGRTSQPVGAVVHVADPRRSLYRLVAAAPSISPSTEVLLVQPDGDSVQVLSRQRFPAAAGWHRRIPLSRSDVPAVMAVLGREGVAQGVDYRGVKVLAALRAVPGTRWFLVVKVDRAEVLDVWRTRVGLVFAVLLGLVLVAGTAAIALGQRSAKAHFRELYEAEAALGASEARFRTLVEEAGDGFALLDADGRYLDVNSACCQQLGYPREELVRLGIQDVDSLFSTERFAADFQRLVGRPPVTYESEHRRKDGTTFPVEVTLSIVKIGGVPQALSLARDTSERKQALQALRESEQRYRLLFEGVTDAVFVHGVSDDDLPSEFLAVNDVACERLGYTREEFLRMTVRDVDAPESAVGVRSIVERLKRGEAVLFEQTHVAKDGRRIPVEIHAQSFTLHGRVVVLSVVRDITERKRAEQALRESEAKYRELIHQAWDAIFVVDRDGKILLVNEQACLMLGYTQAELQQLNVADTYRAEERGVVAERIAEVQRGAQLRYERSVVRKDGTTFPAEVVIGMLPNGLTQGIVRDITERKRADEALRESEERHRSIIEQLNDVYYRTDRNGVLTMMSPSAAHLFGFSSTSEIVGRPMESLWRNPSQRAAMLAAISERGFVRDYEMTVVRTDGTPFTVAVSSHYVRDASGAADGVEGIIRDISERKQAEATLRALARHLEAVREEEHVRIARELHDDLGQAFTALRLDLTWVGRKLPKGSTALRNRIDAAVALTDGMITVGQRIVGELRPPILDDLGLVPAVEWYAQQLAKRSGLRIQIDVGAPEPVVPDHLAVTAYRIVQEALTNVARHAQATQATVRLGGQDGAVFIEVRDDGQGFPEKAASDARSFGITGMRERAASHGGALVIASSPGAGTTVRVTFPPERRKVERAPL